MCQWYQCGCAQDQLQKLWYRELFCFILSQWVSPIWVTDLWIVIASLLCLSRSQAVYSVQCTCIHLFMVVVDVLFLCMYHFPVVGDAVAVGLILVAAMQFQQSFPHSLKGLLFYIQTSYYTTEYFPISFWDIRQYVSPWCCASLY